MRDRLPTAEDYEALAHDVWELSELLQRLEGAIGAVDAIVEAIDDQGTVSDQGRAGLVYLTAQAWNAVRELENRHGAILAAIHAAKGIDLTPTEPAAIE